MHHIFANKVTQLQLSEFNNMLLDADDSVVQCWTVDRGLSWHFNAAMVVFIGILLQISLQIAVTTLILCSLLPFCCILRLSAGWAMRTATRIAMTVVRRRKGR